MIGKSKLSRRSLLALSASLPTVASGRPPRTNDGYVNILRSPDLVTAFLENDTISLLREGPRWTSKGVAVQAEPSGSSVPIRIEAPEAALLRIHLRWKANVPERWRILNDQWERSYGDLEWRGMVGERVLPWYFLAFDGHATHGYGVATGASSFAFWQVDPAGISLWLDPRNGGGPVRLGQRTLEAATVRVQMGHPEEPAFPAAKRFCRSLCTQPRLRSAPVYGGNNWYYAYGRNCSAVDIQRDANLIAELAPAGPNRPFMVIDDGWSVTNTAGPWDRGNSQFPDMPGLASSMKKQGVRPGLWLRPLFTTAAIPRTAQIRRGVMDPTIPEMLEVVRQEIRRTASWGYELIKHDYTSFDLLGRWGFAMGAELTDPGWHFADKTKTTAEITLALYRAIREAAGDTLVLARLQYLRSSNGWPIRVQRTGDDASGRDFNRTRRMGVNTLAFRGPQHRAFFDLDADCAPITPQVPWELTSRWLDVLARSGTALFVSPDPKALNPESKQAIQRAFAAAILPHEVAEPLDWMETTTPSRWRVQGHTMQYQWYGPEGGTPFPK